MTINREVYIFLDILFLIIISVVIRFRPLWKNQALGVDHWYWLLCAEDVKKRRKLPPKLPYFMLEIEEQWYPPLFAGLLAFLPMRWLKDHGGKVSQIIDFLNGSIIFLAALWSSHSPMIAFLLGLSYLVAWFPLTYNTQLQPRGLANFLLTLAMGMLCFYITTGSFYTWVGVLIISVILLFLHKMTIQMWFIYLLGFGAWVLDWKILSIIPASMFLAFLISKGFYIKMLKAHWDIISFWHENIQYLGSHQYYESTLYRKGNFVSTAQHQQGWFHQLRKLLSLFKYNPFILLLPVLLYQAAYRPQGRIEYFLWIWLGLTYLWTLLTTFVPNFLALGGGHYYLYQSFFPLFILASLSISSMTVSLQGWLFVFWGIGFVYSVLKWERYCRSISLLETAKLGDDLKAVLDYLKGLPKDGVFCIPFQLPDGTAYWARKRVFWGGHSYGFHALLKPYFPIMHENVKETLKDKPLNYLLFWQGYLKSLKDIGLEEGKDIRFLFNRGEYELYEIIK